MWGTFMTGRMVLTITLSLASLFAHAAVDWAPPNCKDSKAPLFKSEEPLELTIQGQFPLKGNNHRWRKPEIRFVNPVTAAEIQYQSNGQTVRIPIDVTA